MESIHSQSSRKGRAGNLFNKPWFVAVGIHERRQSMHVFLLKRALTKTQPFVRFVQQGLCWRLATLFIRTQLAWMRKFSPMGSDRCDRIRNEYWSRTGWNREVRYPSHSCVALQTIPSQHRLEAHRSVPTSSDWLPPVWMFSTNGVTTSLVYDRSNLWPTCASNELTTLH